MIQQASANIDQIINVADRGNPSMVLACSTKPGPRPKPGQSQGSSQGSKRAQGPNPPNKSPRTKVPQPLFWGTFTFHGTFGHSRAQTIDSLQRMNARPDPRSVAQKNCGIPDSRLQTTDECFAKPRIRGPKEAADSQTVHSHTVCSQTRCLGSFAVRL